MNNYHFHRACFTLSLHRRACASPSQLLVLPPATAVATMSSRNIDKGLIRHRRLLSILHFGFASAHLIKDKPQLLGIRYMLGFVVVNGRKGKLLLWIWCVIGREIVSNARCGVESMLV